ncbi:helix-turn-helix domain-containing protein [Spirosoma harenae]
MTFYNETILKLQREVYPKDQLIQQVIKAKQFIDLHFAEAIDLSGVASEAFYSKFHFIRCFKSLYGRTPHQYLISVRIERAKEFLQTSDSLTDVCVKVGFDSTTSFIALFKKMTGTTPAAYRKKQFSRAVTENHC